MICYECKEEYDRLEENSNLCIHCIQGFYQIKFRQAVPQERIENEPIILNPTDFRDLKFHIRFK